VNPLRPPIDQAKPLFLPLKGQYFDAFVDGSKDTEYRMYGPRWNERTCKAGRPVLLSRGYGKHFRRWGVIVDFKRSSPPDMKAWYECYGTITGAAACIKIALRNLIDSGLEEKKNG
jgi:hypothetical protein